MGTLKIIIALMFIAVVLIIWPFIEAQVFRVKTIKLKNIKVKGKLKIAFISDIHYDDFYYNLRMKRIVNKINDMRADIIIIGGDYFNIKEGDKLNQAFINKLFSDLSNLKSKCGIISVLGNHDYFLSDDMPLFIEKMRESKITLLKNATYAFNINGEKVLIHGVDDLHVGKIDEKKLCIKDDFLNIVVSHNPDFYEKTNIKYDIAFAGHTHGGQVTLFGIYAPITESKYGQKYAKTMNYKDDSVIITTKGTGCTWLPIRFFAIPEVIEVDIN